MKLILLLILSLLSGCATKKMSVESINTSYEVEITYTLGHSSYRYFAVSVSESIKVSSYRDEHLIEEKFISNQRFQSFLSLVEMAVSKQSEEYVVGECRTTYKIRLKKDNESKTRKGCRSEDQDGEIGKLIKEGEFLFYSE